MSDFDRMTEALDAADHEALAEASNKVAEGLYFGQPQTDPAHTPPTLAADIAREAVRAYLLKMGEQGFKLRPTEDDELMWAAFKAAFDARQAVMRADDLISNFTRPRRVAIVNEREKLRAPHPQGETG